MKVLHLSTHDTKGGAAGSAYRLHHGLRAAGVDSRMFVRDKHSSDETVLEHIPSSSLWSRGRRKVQRRIILQDFRRYADTRPKELEPFSDDRTPYRLQELQDLDYDILNLHWVAGFVDYRYFFDRSIGNTPVIWRLSDLNPFTGGCHYDAGCGKYRNKCGACPQLGSESTNDLARAVWDRKSKAFGKIPDHQLHFVAQSRWIRDQVKASPLTSRFPATVIPNGLDIDVFRPRNGESFRQALEIPSESNVILFVAQSAKNKRKGFTLLAKALQELSKKGQLFLLSVGGKAPDLSLPFPHLHLGTIESNRLLSAVYSAADLFVISSLQDNLPNTVLESMSCGTPVVGFDTGGIPDMVRPEETGWLAPVGDVRALRDAIARALSDDAVREAMATRCREVAVEEYALEVQAKRYIKLYEELMAGASAVNGGAA